MKRINRVDAAFRDLKQKKKTAFIAFITAGDPDLATTEELLVVFEQAGVDIVELGVPFSDPMADGATIQAASERALAKGVNLEQILASVKRIRTKTQIPIVLMTYYNPVFYYGVNQFVKHAKQCGVDGVIVPDLPPEEAKDLIHSAISEDFATVFFVAPTTTNKRAKRNMKAAQGFVYYVSLTGVTGASQVVPTNLTGHLRRIKRMTDKPVCVGFGVSSAQQVKAIGKVADGVIVGSAIVNEIHRHAGQKDLVWRVARFVKGLVRGKEE